MVVGCWMCLEFDAHNKKAGVVLESEAGAPSEGS